MGSGKVIVVDKGLQKIIAQHKKLVSDREVAVGIIEKTNARTDGAATNAMIGTVHEFGSSSQNIPERSFIRSTIKTQRDKIAKLIIKTQDDVINNNLDIETGLGRLGAIVKDMIQRTILKGIAPPPSPETLRRRAKKGGGGPKEKSLIDTGQLLASITWDVRTAGKGGE